MQIVKHMLQYDTWKIYISYKVMAEEIIWDNFFSFESKGVLRIIMQTCF